MVKNNISKTQFLISAWNFYFYPVLPGFTLNNNSNNWFLLINTGLSVIITDFSKVYHSVNEFDGKRFSLVYYTLVSKRPLPEEKPSVVFENGSYIFKRGDVKITNGLPHPLKGRKKKTIEMNKEEGEFIVSFE